MREIELIYIEVMNETEHLFVFSTKFNGTEYAVPIVINTALPIAIQNTVLNKALLTLIDMNRKTAKTAVDSRTF